MKRINLVINDPEYLECLRKNENAEADRIYCCHDLNHFLDVARIAYILSLENSLRFDKEILYGVGLLHDIGRWMEYEQGVDHAHASREIAEKVLKRCDFTELEIKEMLHAIEGHRKEGGSSPLGDILYRADKLSRNCSLCNSIGTCKKYQKGEKPYLLY